MHINTVTLKDHNSLHVGGVGKMIVVTSLRELTEGVMYAKREGLRIHILGGGTNTFFGETLDNLLVIKLDIRGISLEENSDSVMVTAYGGEEWDDVVRLAVEKNLWGIENLSYIPGTVGACPVQNIGAYGVELKDVFVSLAALDLTTLDVVEMTLDACHFGYRDSLFKHNKGAYAIISVTMKLSKLANPVLEYKPLDMLKGKDPTSPEGFVGKGNLQIQDIRDLVIATRKAKLPDYREYPNTGSFFKNPVVDGAQAESLRTQYPDIKLIDHSDGYKIPAAWLIEHVGEFKGVRVGDVGTWPNQPLVLVNYGSAKAEDILSFSEEIITKIKEKTGITLEREVNFVE